MRFGEKVLCCRCGNKYRPKFGNNRSFAVCPGCRKASLRKMGSARARMSGNPHVAATVGDFRPERGDVPGWLGEEGAV